MENGKPWYRRAWLLVGLGFGSLIILGVAAMLGVTLYYVVMFKTGALKPDQPYQSKALRDSVAAALEASPVSSGQIKNLESGDNPSFGDPEARLHIVEFVDFECPYSKQMAPVVREYMKAHAQDSYFVLRDYPSVELHPHAEEAAVAAHCFYLQDKVRYWEYYDWLFDDQTERTPEGLSAAAGKLGADVARFDDCVKNRNGWQDIQRGLTDGVAFEVTGTPTFFFNGRMISGAMVPEFYSALADEVLRQSSGS